MNPFANENLSQDPIHGYIPFTADGERILIDSPWVQRLRQIHQLQTAWLVYPTAEHTRFQHSLGAMHLASRMIRHLYPSLADVCGGALPSAAYLESLLRIAALLHDVGHGPFGHFFDARFLADYRLTHEKLGAHIIEKELGDLIRDIRSNPGGPLAQNETIDPAQVATLIVRPEKDVAADIPRWLALLRSLFSGIYTVDNMDFVLRDAYMTGFSGRAFDIDRLIHYSFFTDRGLTIHQKGFATLTRFITVRAELFRSVYFHRTVRAIDLTLAELFSESRSLVFPGNPLEHLDAYRRFTEFSLLVDVAHWDGATRPDGMPDERKRGLFERWQSFLARRVPWHLAAETTILFETGGQEMASVFGQEKTFEAAIRSLLPKEYESIALRVDIARHLHRPGGHLPTSGQNFLYDPRNDRIRRLEEEELFRHIPQSYRICRVYTADAEHRSPVAAALDRLVRRDAADDPTNM